MHTRRLASFLVGAWMLASLIFGFVSVQNLSNVDKILASPPGPVAKDIEDLGGDITRQLLRYQASQFNRFLTETWGVAQIGLGAAVLSAVLFTAHRSRFLIFSTCVMILIAIIQVAYIRPAMDAMGRSFDFLPLGAAARERDSYQSYATMYTVAEVVKLLIGLFLSGRLLFDRYGWKQKFLPAPPKRLQRKRKSGVGGAASG
ncbi:MAG: hypothetical protein ABI822_31255, partial [Bryobacteraceae bacterium]